MATYGHRVRDDDARQPGRARRLLLAVERDGARCIWCGRDLGGLVEVTREHLVPRTKGGPSWLENEVPACRRCNRERGHRGIVDWLGECERRGWEPDLQAVVRSLTALERAIAERGGHRRARDYVDAAQRRLRKRSPPN